MKYVVGVFFWLLFIGLIVIAINTPPTPQLGLYLVTKVKIQKDFTVKITDVGWELKTK